MQITIRPPSKWIRAALLTFLNFALGVAIYIILVNRGMGIRVGDTQYFGAYEQDNNTANGKEAIEWRILSLENDRMLLITQKSLDYSPYHDHFEPVTWAYSSLRKWLNTGFFYTAFSEGEMNAIVEATLKNGANPENGTEGGLDTPDRIFLLSIEEAERYFAGDKDRRAENTNFAKAKGVDDDTYGYWWLRSPGKIEKQASYVRNDGSINMNGANINVIDKAIRPAVWRIVPTPTFSIISQIFKFIIALSPYIGAFATLLSCYINIQLNLAGPNPPANKMERYLRVIAWASPIISLIILVSTTDVEYLFKLIYQDLQNKDYLLLYTVALVSTVEICILQQFIRVIKRNIHVRFMNSNIVRAFIATLIFLLINFCILHYVILSLHMEPFIPVGILSIIVVCFIEYLTYRIILKKTNNLVQEEFSE